MAESLARRLVEYIPRPVSYKLCHRTTGTSVAKPHSQCGSLPTQFLVSATSRVHTCMPGHTGTPAPRHNTPPRIRPECEEAIDDLLGQCHALCDVACRARFVSWITSTLHRGRSRLIQPVRRSPTGERAKVPAECPPCPTRLFQALQRAFESQRVAARFWYHHRWVSRVDLDVKLPIQVSAFYIRLSYLEICYSLLVRRFLRSRRRVSARILVGQRVLTWLWEYGSCTNSKIASFTK